MSVIRTKKFKDNVENMKITHKPKPLEAEIVNETLPVIQPLKPKGPDLSNIKPVEISLDTTDKYITKLLRMAEKNPEKVLELINKQTDLLLMVTKEGALRYLSYGIEYNDREALDIYRQLVEASAIVMNDKSNLSKILGVNTETGAQVKKSYQTPKMSIEEWEKSFKPGLPAPSLDPDKVEKVYSGPKPNSVN